MIAAALVDRATSDMLIGPDWSINMELCDVLNADPGQTKDVVKLLKKRLNSKHSKVQLLTLALLETLIKNCGDVVHMHVAEKSVLNEMVKIVKKKPDFHVKEKILILIDTWQEAFGGPRARYPQYYTAYQELLRYGVVFPQRPESSAPIFTPPQTKPLSSYSRPIHKPELYGEVPESSSRSDLPTLSLEEIQNAHGVVDVLTEILSAMDPAKKEDLKQEVILELVEQCRSYKQRVIQLVSTSLDERLLSKGLTLNDDLQRVLAQRDAIASGIAVKVEKQRPVADATKFNAKVLDTVPQQNGKISTTASNTSDSPPAVQSLPPALPSSNGSVTPPARLPQIDLLSGDFNPPENENPLALVPVSVYSTTSTSDQNVLALTDMFAQKTIAESSSSVSSPYPMPQAYTTSPNARMGQQRMFNSSSFNGMNPTSPQMDRSYSMPMNQPDRINQTWTNSGLDMQHLKPLSLGNEQSGEALPPPPWEMQQANGYQPEVTGPTLFQLGQVPQMGGTYPQQMPQSPHFVSGYPPNPQMVAPSPYQMQGGSVFGSRVQATQMPGGGYIYERWVVPPADARYYDQTRYPYPNMYPTTSVQSGTAAQGGGSLMNPNPAYQSSSSLLSLKQASRPARPEDKLFGDLVDLAKTKHANPAAK